MQTKIQALKFYKKCLEKKFSNLLVETSTSRIVKIIELSPTKVQSNTFSMKINLSRASLLKSRPIIMIIYLFYLTCLFLYKGKHFIVALLSRMKEVDLTVFIFLLSFLLFFQFIFLYSMFRTRVRVKVTRSRCHTAGHIR